MNGDYVKITRSMLEWGWYKDEHTKSLFLHCILRANWRAKEFKGILIKRGQFVTSIPSLQVDLGLTSNEVRTAIKHLKTTGEITVRAYSKFSVFTVVNYDLYQGESHAESQTDDSQVTVKSQPINSLLTTIEERNKGRIEEDKKSTLCDSEALTLFEELWKLYPSKKGKGQVSLAAKQRLLKVGREEMVRAIDRYKTELEKDSDWRKPQNGSTFFKSGYVDYLDANYVPSKKTSSRNGFNNYQGRSYDAATMIQLIEK